MSESVIARRVRSLSKTALLHVDAVQDERGRTQILLKLRAFVAGEAPAVTETTIAVPPNRLFDVAEALTGVARDLGMRP